MSQVITRGKTVEMATELALQQLGVSRDRVTIHIRQHPRRGLFGFLGRRDAEVAVQLIEEAPKQQVPVEPAQVAKTAPTEPVRDPIEETRGFILDVIAAMNLEHVEVDVVETQENAYTFRLSGEAIGMLIGRRGVTLDALQYLVNLVANKHSDRFLRIVLDAEDYRNRRKETLERLADRLANKAVQQSREILLEPMPSTERKIIHSYLQERHDVVTYSQGDEPYRKVVIAPKARGQNGKRERGPRRKKATTTRTK